MGIYRSVSFKELKLHYPEYIENPFSTLEGEARGMAFVDYTNLKVTEQQIQEFSAAIVAFWNDVPDNIYDDSIREQCSTR